MKKLLNYTVTNVLKFNHYRLFDLSGIPWALKILSESKMIIVIDSRTTSVFCILNVYSMSIHQIIYSTVDIYNEIYNQNFV